MTRRSTGPRGDAAASVAIVRVVKLVSARPISSSARCARSARPALARAENHSAAGALPCLKGKVREGSEERQFGPTRERTQANGRPPSQGPRAVVTGRWTPVVR